MFVRGRNRPPSKKHTIESGDTTPLPAERLNVLGCKACHTLGGSGFSDPGGALESVASRSPETLRAFLAKPDAETTRELHIRETPTGAMAGLKLTPEEINLLVETLGPLFELRSPSGFGSGTEKIADIVQKKTCLACHTVRGQGAPGGGIGGLLEHASHLTEETLRAWLQDPSAENAVKLKIRETPIGAMTSFALTEEEIETMTPWLLSLEKKGREQPRCPARSKGGRKGGNRKGRFSA